MLCIGKRIDLQQWSSIQGSHQTAGSHSFKDLWTFFFAEKTVTGISYLDMVEMFLILQLQQETEVADIVLQQDGTLPHYHCMVTSLLDDTFSNMWVCQGGPVGWPPWSHDLTSFDFHF
jgi:hypothetical protein